MLIIDCTQRHFFYILYDFTSDTLSQLHVAYKFPYMFLRRDFNSKLQLRYVRDNYGTSRETETSTGFLSPSLSPRVYFRDSKLKRIIYARKIIVSWKIVQDIASCNYKYWTRKMRKNK